tara:strand:- start:485 stop:1213 length:729 start_codon:yes stop_codon:yes gene_type:complete
MAFFKNKLNQKIAYKYFKGKSPGIIYIHGMASDMEGTKSLSIEKYSQKKGLSFLRFDCRGHGKSYGDFHNFTIKDWKNDLIEMIDKKTKGPQILIGSSLGAWIMMLATKHRKPRIAGLIGLAPAPDATKYLMNELPKKFKNEINKKGMAKFKKLNVIMTKKFFEEGNKNLVLNKNFPFKKPFILIHGLKDKDVSPQISKKILKIVKGKNIQIRYLKESDHRLSNKNDLLIINNSIDNILESI